MDTLEQYKETTFIYFIPDGSDGKESACNEGDPGSTPESGRSPGEGNGNTLQYSCLENSMDRGAWWAYSPWSHKELDTTKCLTLFTLKSTVLPRRTSSPSCSQLTSFDTCFLSILTSLIYQDPRPMMTLHCGRDTFCVVQILPLFC